MCTYTLALEDKLVEQARPMFRDKNAMKEWLQSQMEILFVQYVTIHSSKKPSKPKLSEKLRGIGVAPRGGITKRNWLTVFE